MATFSRSMSRRSSIATIPSMEGAHRLDLLIQEQRTSVINAQEGLRQSLAILERAHSKEEKESAKMQVQSLLTRAEEITFLVKVVHAIRTELNHVQADIESSKKSHQNPRPLYVRQQWLESRLESLLLAKKRGRPGGRGQRTLAATLRNIPQRPSISTRKSLDTISSELESMQESFEGLSDFTRPTSLSTRETNFPAPLDSKPDSIMRLSRDFRNRSVATETSSASKDGSLEASSYQTESNESWHSDSEANWTLPGGSIRHLKDLGQSQTLSEIPDESSTKGGGGGRGGGKVHRRTSVTFDDPPSTSLQQTKDKVMPAFIEQEEGEEEEGVKMPQPSSDVQVVLSSTGAAGDAQVASAVSVHQAADNTVSGFELPRSSEVFGDCSWNMLPLAIRSNLVEPAEEQSPSAHNERFRDVSAVRGALDNFCAEADVLKQLIVNAARATVKSGPLVSASRKSALKSYVKSSSSRDIYSGPISGNKVGAAATTTTASRSIKPASSATSSILPPIEPARNGLPRSSRRLYGVNKLEDYPRCSSTWNQTNAYFRSTNLARTTTHERLMTSHVDRCLEKYENAAIQTKRSGQRSRRSTRPETITEDLFDRAKYRQRRVDDLCKQLESSNIEIRRDGVQALGQLSGIGEHAKDRLLSLLSADKDISVKYRALYSLLQHGIVTEQTIAYCSAFLPKVIGSAAIQEELLQLMCQDDVIDPLVEKLINQECEAYNGLHKTLEKLLAVEEGKIPALAAKILSHAHLSKELCFQRLKGILHSPLEEVQSMALESLCLCWQCGDEDVLDAAMHQMANLSHWKFRTRAVECLCEVSAELERCKGSQAMFKNLTTRLRNEPMLVVRVAIGKLLRLLKLSADAQELFLSELSRSDEVIRNNAVIALTAFELKQKTTILALLEIMMLDPSVYVRVQVVRAFEGMTHYDPDVITSLIKRSREHGVLARASTVALDHIYKHLEPSA